MARGTFSTTNYLSASESRFTDYPVSISGWSNAAVNNASMTISTVSDTATNNNYFGLELAWSIANDPVNAILNVGGVFGSAAYNTTTGPTNEWHHATAIAASTTLREVQYDLNDGTDSTTTRNFPSGVDTVSLGARVTTSVAAGLNGYVAEVGIWDVALTEFERDALAHGCSPMLVRPTALRSYYPCFQSFTSAGEPNWANGPHLAETGTIGSGAPHPQTMLAYPVP